MTSLLAVTFFATSFGLAMIASDKSSPVDDLGLDIPAAAKTVQPEPESDFPQVEDEFPEATAMGDDIPEVEDEFPVAPADAPATEEDVPSL
jgi:preprotein translocase subunit SecG